MRWVPTIRNPSRHRSPEFHPLHRRKGPTDRRASPGPDRLRRRRAPREPGRPGSGPNAIPGRPGRSRHPPEEKLLELRGGRTGDRRGHDDVRSWMEERESMASQLIDEVEQIAPPGKYTRAGGNLSRKSRVEEKFRFAKDVAPLLSGEFSEFDRPTRSRRMKRRLDQLPDEFLNTVVRAGPPVSPRNTLVPRCTPTLAHALPETSPPRSELALEPIRKPVALVQPPVAAWVPRTHQRVFGSVINPEAIAARDATAAARGLWQDTRHWGSAPVRGPHRPPNALRRRIPSTRATSTARTAPA